MREPGAQVAGHRATVSWRDLDSTVACSCGYAVQAQPSVQGACLSLVQHLEAAVRDGAEVVRGGEGGGDGLAGVREPRRPLPSAGSGGVELDRA